MSHAANNPYHLGRATWRQAVFWYRQRRLEEARSGALHAIDVFEKLGATGYMEDCRKFLQEIEAEMN